MASVGVAQVDFQGNFTALQRGLAGVLSTTGLRRRGKLAGAALVGGLAAAAAGMVKSVQAASEFERQMTLVQTQAGASAKEVKNLSGQVLNLAKSGSEFSPAELAKGLFRVESAGYRGARAMEILDAATRLAEVGQAELEETTHALTGVMRTGIRGSKNLGSTIGTLNAVIGAGSMRMDDLNSAISTGFVSNARQMGLSLQQAGAALAAVTRQGQPARQAATRLSMAFRMMNAPTDKAKSALEGIGVSWRQLGQLMQAHRFPEAMGVLVEHLEALGRDPEGKRKAAEVIRAVFGARSASGITTIIQGLKQYNSTLNQVEENQAAFPEAFRKEQSTLHHQWLSLVNSVKAFEVELGTALIPAAVKAVGALRMIGDALKFTFSSFTNFTAVLAGGMLAKALFASLGGSLMMSQLGMIGGLWAARLVQSLGGGLAVAAGGFAIVNILSSALSGNFRQAGIKLGGALSGGMIGFFATGGNPLGAAIGAAIGSGLAPALVNTVTGLFRSGDAGGQYLQKVTQQVAAATAKQRGALSGLTASTHQLAAAHQHERKTSEGVRAAQQALNNVRRNEPGNTRAIARATANLAWAKARDAEATRKEARAEQVHGVERQAYKQTTKATIQLLGQHRQALLNTKNVIMNEVAAFAREHKGQKLSGDDIAWLNRKRQMAANVQTQLTQNTKRYNAIIAESAGKVGPKFAKTLKLIHDRTQETFYVKGSQKFIDQFFKAQKGPKGLAEATYKGAKNIQTNLKGSAKGLGVPPPTYGLVPPGQIIAKKAGGFVIPGTGATDNTLLQAMVQPGEAAFILNKRATGWLQALNQAIPYRKKGGLLDQDISGPTGEMKVIGNAAMDRELAWANRWVKRHKAVGAGKAAWGPVDALAARWGLGRGTLTGRIGQAGWHGVMGPGGRARATDYSGSPAGMLTFARKAARRWGKNLLELIHTPLGFGIKEGRRVPLAFWGPGTNAQHFNHVHLALQKGGLIKGRVSWFGDTGNAMAGGGQPSRVPGIALYNRATLGNLYKVVIAGHIARLRQVDVGPAPSTGRKIDVTQAGLRSLGFTTRNFPTDAMGVARLVTGGAGKGGGAGAAGGKGKGSKTPKLPEGLRKKIAKLGLAVAIQAKIDAVTTDAERFGEFADRANTLGAPVFGRAEKEWLNDQLAALFRLRNLLVMAYQQLAERIARLNKMLRKAVGKVAKKAITDQITANQEKSSEILDTLKEVQGFGPLKVLTALPPIGELGGSIFDVQNRLRELGQTATEAPTGLTAGQLRELGYLKSLGLVFNPGQFAGMFARGGILGAGQWGIAGERGPEPVVGPARVVPGSDIKVILEDHRTTVIKGEEVIAQVAHDVIDSRERASRGAYRQGVR